MGGGREVVGRCEQTVTTPLCKVKTRRAKAKKAFSSRGIPGRFLSLVLISPNLA